MTDERAAVVLDDRRQLRSGELAVGHPARELVVPHAVMSSEELSVGLRQVRDLITSRKGERALLRLCSILLYY